MTATAVLIATALVGGICSVLAALLLVAERYLANYGTCTLRINDGSKTLEVRGGRTLLASLMAEGIFIPSACGGRGTCAYCKLRVLDGGGPLLATEEPLLTPEEAADDVRLSCQVKVRNDVALEIPDELFAIQQFRGVVEEIRDLTHDIKYLRIRLLEPDAIAFQPGQYIQLEAPPYGDNPEPIYRAYSIASPPSEPHRIELIIRLAPGGICTTWVFTRLSEGGEVAFNGPYGDFRLSDSDREMVWIAGGSGMAPFWCIIRHMREHNVQRPCTYFFGAVQERDLFLVDELRALENEMPSFHFVPALSGLSDFDRWRGQRGLITDVVARHLTDGANQEGYLCGSAGMIDAAIKVLRAKGIGEDRIFYDKFN